MRRAEGTGPPNHHGASVAHLWADLAKLDRLFHHVEDQVADMARFGELDRRALRHFRQDLRRFRETLHHLREHL